MKEARVDRGGSISFAEFSRLMGVGIKHTVEADPEEDMRHAFRLFDQDKDGFISPKEMISALSKFGITINDKEVKQLIGEATLGGGSTTGGGGVGTTGAACDFWSISICARRASACEATLSTGGGSTTTGAGGAAFAFDSSSICCLSESISIWALTAAMVVVASGTVRRHMPAAERTRRVRGMFELWCVARSRGCLGVFGCSLTSFTAAREPS